MANKIVYCMRTNCLYNMGGSCDKREILIAREGCTTFRLHPVDKDDEAGD
jgi:hypothetical protein